MLICAAHTLTSRVATTFVGAASATDTIIGCIISNVPVLQVTEKLTLLEYTSERPPEMLCTQIWSKVLPLVDAEIGRESFTAIEPLPGIVMVAPLTTFCTPLTKRLKL